MKKFFSPFAFFGEIETQAKINQVLSAHSVNKVATINGKPQAVFNHVEFAEAPAARHIQLPLFSGDRALRGLEMIEYKPVLRLTHNLRRR